MADEGREWQPGDPVFADAPERGHCLNAACGATWVPAGASTCPECGSLAGAACVMNESNDMEAFAALPDCLVCGGMGKQVPPGFWGAEPGAVDDAAVERVAEVLWRRYWREVPGYGITKEFWRGPARAAVAALRGGDS